jgi:hypothetical protein
MAITIPKKINIGFQERCDTYTGKLSYIIYFDEKGVLRKEKSWQSWRDNNIENIIYDNEPIEGFVLNKKAGGYSTGWNHRQTYVRVYDPRGFEFEITIPNLLYILENTNSIKGKGLEGKFVYGWDGTELLLIPISSPDYIEISKFSKLLQENKIIKTKDLIIGATYKSKDNRELVYIGKYDKYNYTYDYTKNKNGNRKAIKKPYISGNEFFFYDLTNENVITMKTINNKLIYVLDDKCISNYAYIVDKLEFSDEYSPYDYTMDEYKEYSFDDLKNKIEKDDYWSYVYIKKDDDYFEARISKSYYNYEKDKYINELQVELTEGSYNSKQLLKNVSIEKIYEELKPSYIRKYLSNGKLLEESK